MDPTEIVVLEKLKAESRKANPVRIAGYGRESTHKGYLAWILDGCKNDQAMRVLRVLCEAAGETSFPDGGTDLKTVCEYRLSPRRRKVDVIRGLMIKRWWFWQCKLVVLMVFFRLFLKGVESGSKMPVVTAAPSVYSDGGGHVRGSDAGSAWPVGAVLFGVA